MAVQPNGLVSWENLRFVILCIFGVLAFLWTDRNPVPREVFDAGQKATNEKLESLATTQKEIHAKVNEIATRIRRNDGLVHSDTSGAEYQE